MVKIHIQCMIMLSMRIALTWALLGIAPAVAVTTAATFDSHGGLLQRAMDVGRLESTMALSDTGITLGLFPVVKQIGKRSVTDFGMGMGLGAERNFGPRTPILTPKSQIRRHSSHNFLTVKTMSLHAYSCFSASFGPEELKKSECIK
jgi:hypothetical protein